MYICISKPFSEFSFHVSFEVESFDYMSLPLQQYIGNLAFNQLELVESEIELALAN